MAGRKVSKASTKRQAKLNFTPVPSSSPAAAYLSPEVRSRAAAISYEGSPSKRRKLDSGTEHNVEASEDRILKSGLLTPVKSSQLHSNGTSKPVHLEESSESDLPRTVKRKKGSKATDWQHRVASIQSYKERHSGKRDADTSHNVAVPIQAPGRNATHGKHELVDLSGERTDSSSDFDGSVGEALPAQPHIPEQRNRARSERSRKQSKRSDEEGLRTRSSTKKSQRSREEKPSRSETHNKAAQELRDFLGSDDSDDEANLASSPTKRSKPKSSAARGGRSKRDGLDDFINDGDDAEEDEGADEPVTPRRRRSDKQVVISDGEDESDADKNDEDDIPAKSRSRSARGRKQSRQEEDDLEEDLEFLRSSPPSVQKRSAKVSPKKSARQQALDRLRQARGGPKQADLTNGGSTSTQRRRRTIAESESEEEEAEANDQDEDGTGDEDEDDLDDAGPSRSHGAEALEMFQEDDGDEGFVIEDEEDPLGAPGEIPIEFTSLARAKSKDLFRFAIDWMVQKRINPAFDVVGDVYDLTFRKLDDEVTGLVGSKYKSSVWRPEFSYALDARPQVEVDTISPDVQLDFNNCEACGRSNHPATYSMRFHGKAYNRTTLDEIEQDSDSDQEDEDEEDGEKQDHDAQGRVIPPESKTFAVGQFCMRNAQTGHTLTHWRYHLYDWVVDWLKIEGHLDPQKVIARDSWSTKKRRKDAQHIVQLMEEKGEIKRLHKDFRIQVTDARDAKQGGRYGR